MALDRATPTLVQRLREPALAALGWIDVYGDRDEDGFVEYERRTPRGLENQSWKDSGDSQRFHDGSFAQTPIAPAEVQGYVYDAKLRLAELARAVWDDVPLAERLEAEAAALRIRFDDRYWVDERGGYYALALDGEKRPVDSLCSNLGHLLWSGIVPPERVETIANRLLGDELWSGWGIRTMSTARCRVQPAQLPQRHGLAARHLARRLGSRPRRAGGGRVDDRERPARGGALLRLVAAGGVRGLQARRDAVPDRLPDRSPSAGVGRGHADPAAAAAARARARPGEPRAPHHRCGGARAGWTASSCWACARSGAPGTSRSRTGA